MKRLKPWQILAIVGLCVLFGLRIYFAKQKDKDQERKQQIIRDLSIEQLHQDSVQYHEEAIIPSEQVELLDPIQDGLDSIGIKLKEDHERFKQQFGIEEE